MGTRLARAFSGLVCLLPWLAAADSATGRSSADTALNGIAPIIYYRSIRNLAAGEASTWRIFDRVVENNPDIAREPVEKLANQTDLLILLRHPDDNLVQEFQRDMATQVSKTAITEHRVVLLPADIGRDQSQQTTSISPADVHRLPPDLLALSANALADHVLMLRPACRDGVKKIRPDGTEACSGGDPWSLSEFDKVVPVRIDGEVVCTGTLLSNTRVITAAHCVTAYDSNSKPIVVDSKRLSVLTTDNRIAPAVGNPRVPTQWGACDSSGAACGNSDYDFAVIDIPPLSSPSSIYPQLIQKNMNGVGSVTVAGYGASTLLNSAATHGLNIGRQSVDFTAATSVLKWEYDYSQDPLSSICNGDSGGPIFLGNPRKDGDDLSIVGIVTRYVPEEIVRDLITPKIGTCRKTTVTAINLSSGKMRSELCSLLQDPASCK